MANGYIPSKKNPGLVTRGEVLRENAGEF